MHDRLVVWLLVAVAFVALISLAVVGLQPVALFGLLHVPAVLMVLLAMRAAICLLRHHPTALRVGSAEVLSGWWSLAVPLLLLALWVAGRETGTFSARLTNSRHDERHSATWHSDSAQVDAGGVVTSGDPVPARLEIVGGEDTLHERFAERLQGLSQAVPGQRVLGRIELQIGPPMALLPLCKSAQTKCQIRFDLVLLANGSQQWGGHLQGTMDFDSSWSMLGFASQRDLHDYIGVSLGETARAEMTTQLQKLTERPR